VLRPRDEATLAAWVATRATRLPHERGRASGLGTLLTADAAAVAAAGEFAAAAGLAVVAASARRRLVVLEGTWRDLERAFQVDCAWHRHGEREFLAHSGPIHLPRALAGHVLAVVGLDQRPLARPGVCGGRADERHLSPSAVARLYDFPPDLDGRGERLGIVLLGGGFHDADLDAFFRQLRLARPAMRVRGVDGAANAPADPAAIRDALTRAGIGGRPLAALAHATPAAEGGDVHWTIEATLDVELAGALAPGAELQVVFAPPTLHGKVHAFSRLLAARPRPAVISASWAGFESAYRDQDVRAMESLFVEAAAKDVTLCFASGDGGDGTATFGGPSDAPAVFYPPSSPHVLACGGTTLAAGGGRETVWAETLAGHALGSGGGVSGRFARPDWQDAAPVPRRPRGGQGRGVPDVAAKADIRGGYRIVVGDEEVGMGGTSAATPLWASLLVRINQALRRAGHPPAGYLTPLLYRNDIGGALRDIVAGDNGTYHAGKGWDACTGWGSPRGRALLEALLPPKRSR
jgi:kumamolisin